MSSNVSLKDYVERIFEEHDKAISAAFMAQEKSMERARAHIEAIFEEHRKAHLQKHMDDERALEQARHAVDLRLEKLNELRSEVLQDRGEFVRRDVYDQDIKSREERFAKLDGWQSRASGAAVILTLIAGLIGAAVMRALGS